VIVKTAKRAVRIAMLLDDFIVSLLYDYVVMVASARLSDTTLNTTVTAINSLAAYRQP
jgi:hypothetical protein